MNRLDNALTHKRQADAPKPETKECIVQDGHGTAPEVGTCEGPCPAGRARPAGTEAARARCPG